MAIIICVTLIFFGYFLGEYIYCVRRRNSIRIRVLVNGTRGKSSVTRLISAAMRKAGIKTIAKVSGSEPRIIYPDAQEKQIIRRGLPNIIEQVKFLKEAARVKAEVAVMEVMALIPKYQWITEHTIFKSTLGVITNIRPDHLDVMGPTLNDVAEAISGTIPTKAVLISAENSLKDFLKAKSAANGSELSFVTGESITDEMMRPFSYLEHRENVACALEVCHKLGIDRNTALQGMYEAVPDPGVLRTFYVHTQGKKFEFINAFSANDPASTFQIWRRVEKKFIPEQTKIVLINCRKDRLARSIQLSEFVVRDLPLDYLLLTGEGTSHAEQKAVQNGFNRDKIFNMKHSNPDKIFDKVAEVVEGHGVLFAAGNIGGRGMEIVQYFEGRKNG